MFKKLYQGASPADRPQLYSLTDFCLAAVLRMMEFTAFLLLFSYLTLTIYTHLVVPCGQALGSFLSILASFLAWLLLRFPFALARSQLRNAFQLDPRPFSQRLKPMLKEGLMGLITATVFGGALFYFLRIDINIVLWAFIFLVFVYVCFLSQCLYPHLAFAFNPSRFRKALPDELPSGIKKVLSALPDKNGINPEEVYVDTAFSPGLKPPSILKGRIIIPEKALSALTPPALNTQLTTIVLSQLVNIPRNSLIYRGLSLALSVPLSLILLNSMGLMTGYPLNTTVNLVALFWLGTWAAYWFSDFFSLILSRTLCLKLAAATVAVTKDVPGLFDSIQSTARYNLEPAKVNFVRDLFRERPAPEQQIKRLKGSLMELTDEALRQSSERKSKKNNHAKSAGQGPKGAKDPTHSDYQENDQQFKSN
ncbi:MAG: hypothetical protein LBE27_01570 [Deltaproteobacteria bacterium]|jgi:hypothetical protein|nr:hypothetical protein [Deltaproteobacteria bacterium]